MFLFSGKSVILSLIYLILYGKIALKRKDKWLLFMNIIQWEILVYKCDQFSICKKFFYWLVLCCVSFWITTSRKLNQLNLAIPNEYHYPQWIKTYKIWIVRRWICIIRFIFRFQGDTIISSICRFFFYFGSVQFVCRNVPQQQ